MSGISKVTNCQEKNPQNHHLSYEIYYHRSTQPVKNVSRMTVKKRNFDKKIKISY